MGELIMFRPRGLSSGRSGAAASDGAQILLFTGVRYERISDDDVPPNRPDNQATPGDGGYGGARGGRRRRRG
jgi:hypothetical protein